MINISVRHILDLIKKGLLPKPEGFVDLDTPKPKKERGCSTCGK